MVRLPLGLGLFDPFAGWSDIPKRTEARNTFFTSPIFASGRALSVYHKRDVLASIAFLRARAKELKGIDWFQVIWDRSDERAGLVIIEESEEGGPGVGVLLDQDSPARTVVMLEDEVGTYCLRGGWELTGMTRVEGSSR